VLSALIHERMNEFSKARDAYEKLLSAKPDFPPVLNNLAYLYAERLGELDKAYDLAQRARALQPGDAAIADTLGWILYKRGEQPFVRQPPRQLTSQGRNRLNADFRCWEMSKAKQNSYRVMNWKSCRRSNPTIL
jgi:Flp pilus assembly protein TadD